jgi:hypothetical protein
MAYRPTKKGLLLPVSVLVRISYHCLFVAKPPLLDGSSRAHQGEALSAGKVSEGIPKMHEKYKALQNARGMVGEPCVTQGHNLLIIHKKSR